MNVRRMRCAALGAAWLAVAAPVRAADPCATTAGTVRGSVVTAGGAPLAGARVRVQGCLGEPVRTAADGGFTLAVPPGLQVIAAAAGGHYNGCWRGSDFDCAAVAAGATDLAIVLDPLPADDDPAYVFRTAESCKPCHPAVYEQWNRSTMAHTNGNVWVDNLYNGTALDLPPGPPPDPQNPPFFSFLTSHNLDPRHPARTGECANCHQPEYVGTAPTATNFNAFSGAGRHGISCDFCHKIVDVDVSPAGIRRPNLVTGTLGLPAKTTMLRSTAEPWLVLGPLDDVTFPGVPDMRAGHAPVVHSSRLCASCHEDSADPRDANDDFRETYDGPPSQTTYSEWAASDYAARGVECQDCHMPPTGADHFCERTANHRDPSQVRSHVFEGTSPEFLRRAVTLRAQTHLSGSTLAVDVEVTNSGAGHHFPTGVTLRNVILLVTAAGRDGVRLAQLPAEDGVVSRVPNWGGVGAPEEGNFAGLPGKGYARVLVDENLVENVLFTEAVNVFDGRIPAGATDATHYRFALPRGWQKQDVRVETRLYYRRAFKPAADQRGWNVPRGKNAHGTRGDGTDYDENLVVAMARSALTCRGRVGTLTASGQVSSGRLELGGTLKLPRGTTLDPVANGVQVTLGASATAPPLVQEDLTGFAVEGKTIVYTGEGTPTVRSVRLTGTGRRAFRVALELAGVDGALLGRRRLVVGLDSGEVCFRTTLRCKATGDDVRCR